MFCFGVYRLGEANAEGPNRLLALDCQVREEWKLFAALLHVSLKTVMRAPGFLDDDHGDRRIRFSVGAALGNLLQALARDKRVMIWVKIEIGDAQQAAISARGIENAGGSET